jgi:hypothetical protein
VKHNEQLRCRANAEKLYTHASMMFANDCVGELQYEGTTSAIAMAGLFLSFLVEYFGSRIVIHKTRKMHSISVEERAKAVLQTEVVSILVMEAGIIFHSLRKYWPFQRFASFDQWLTRGSDWPYTCGFR